MWTDLDSTSKRTKSRVLGIGGATWDELLYIPELPQWNRNYSVNRRESYAGGMVATALAAVETLGIETLFAGVFGEDSAGEQLHKALSEKNMGLELFRRLPGSSSQSVILVDSTEGHRSILNSRGVQSRLKLDHSDEILNQAQRADLIHLDGHFLDSLMDILPQLREPAPIITLDPSSLLLSREKTSLLISYCDYLIPSWSWAERYTGSSKLELLFQKLLPMAKKGLIITCGAGGCYYATRDKPEILHLPAFSIDPVDTTGAGDAFHGGFISALLQGASLSEALIRASAVAALNCRGRGAQEALPDSEEVEAFLHERNS